MARKWVYFVKETQQFIEDADLEAYLAANPTHTVWEAEVDESNLTTSGKKSPTQMYIRKSSDNEDISVLDIDGEELQLDDDPVITQTYIQGDINETLLKTVSGTISTGSSLSISGVEIDRLLGLYYYPINMEANLATTWKTHDPNNYSTNERGLNDGSTIGLVYNNSSTGAAGKWFAYDSGSNDSTVTVFTVWDWNATYVALSFAFEASNDADFSNILYTQTFSNTATTGRKEYSLTTPATGRYFRIRCITPNNTTYWVITEFEVFYSYLSTELKAAIEGEVSVFENDNYVVVSGIDIPTTTLKVVYI